MKLQKCDISRNGVKLRVTATFAKVTPKERETDESLFDYVQQVSDFAGSEYQPAALKWISDTQAQFLFWLSDFWKNESRLREWFGTSQICDWLTTANNEFERLADELGLDEQRKSNLHDLLLHGFLLGEGIAIQDKGRERTEQPRNARRKTPVEPYATQIRELMSEFQLQDSCDDNTARRKAEENVVTREVKRAMRHRKNVTKARCHVAKMLGNNISMGWVRDRSSTANEPEK
jgi:hypothetical protein